MHYIAQSLVAINDRSAHLTWDPVDDHDMDGYNLYMATQEPRGFRRVNGRLITTPFFLTEILRPDVLYFFRVTSVDTSGNESEPSAYIEFKLSDYKADPQLRLVTPPHKLKITAGKKVVKPVYMDFTTKFQWADELVTGLTDVAIPKNNSVIRQVPGPSFNTLFKLGG